MDKAVLFMNMSQTCSDCIFCLELHEDIEACCEIEDKPLDKSFCRMLEVRYCQGKSLWCPFEEISRCKTQ